MGVGLDVVDIEGCVVPGAMGELVLGNVVGELVLGEVVEGARSPRHVSNATRTSLGSAVTPDGVYAVLVSVTTRLMRLSMEDLGDGGAPSRHFDMPRRRCRGQECVDDDL